MGNASCVHIKQNQELTDKEMKFLLENTHFNEQEINNWYKNFIVSS